MLVHENVQYSPCTFRQHVCPAYSKLFCPAGPAVGKFGSQPFPAESIVDPAQATLLYYYTQPGLPVPAVPSERPGRKVRLWAIRDVDPAPLGPAVKVQKDVAGPGSGIETLASQDWAKLSCPGYPLAIAVVAEPRRTR